MNSVFTAKTSNASDSTRWYNYGTAMAYDALTIFGDTSQLYGNNLFPDSTILVDYGTEIAGTWIHKLGDVLDVSSTYFNNPDAFPDEIGISKTSTYSVDSLGFWFIYTRGLNDPSVVDTLVFEVAVNSNLTTGYFCCTQNTGLTVAQNLNVDTVFFKSLPYTYQSNTLNLPGKQTYKFPLTAAFLADTSANGFSHAVIATTGLSTVNAGKFVAATVSFVPGYSWTPNVDMLEDKNSVFFLSYQEGQNDRFPDYVKRDYNVSYFVSTGERYNTSGWNGNIVPSFAYEGGAAPLSYEHHLIEYLVKCQTGCAPVGIEEESVLNGIVLSQNIPNPSKGNSQVNYELTTAENVLFEVFDLQGRKVLSYNEGQKMAGKHSIELESSKLESGTYYYSLITEKGKLTRKMLIAK